MIEGGLKRTCSRSIRLALVGLALICSWALAASPTDADAAGSFTCRAMGTTKAATTVANPANNPCAADTARVGFGAPVAVGINDPTCFPSICQGPLWGFGIQYDYVDASTRPALDGQSVASDVRVNQLDIYPIDQGFPVPNALIELNHATLRADASATCAAPAGSSPSLTATTGVAYTNLAIGPNVEITDPIEIDLTPAFLGTIHLNWMQSSSNEIVARALWWDIPGQGTGEDFIAGESRAGFTGNPCT